MNRIFVLIGRASVRFRYLIVAVWIVATILAVQTLPALSSVAKNTTSGFLPADVPSMRAAAMAGPFQDASLARAVLIAVREGGLTSADNGALDAISKQARAIPDVRAVIDLGVSRDGAAREILIEAEVDMFAGGKADALVSALRRSASSGAPAGLETHVTGELATLVDNEIVSGASQDRTQNYSLLFIIVLLVLAFRAVLAPIVTLIPAVFVLFLSGPVIAQSASYGIQVSGITQFMLIVLILGAGTDYGVFLVFRVREELRRGLSGPDAVVRSVARVGESISFSAFTVIAALVSLALAEFGLYQSMGPSLAIGIALMLCAGLTLLPALLSIFGRAVFWPSSISPRADARTGLWDRIGLLVARRPALTLVVGIGLFGALALAVLTTRTVGFGDVTSSASGTDSAAGSALIDVHFPSTTASRTAILLTFDDPIWSHMGSLETADAGLAALPEFRGLAGPLDPNGTRLTAAQLADLHATLGPARELPSVQTTTSVSAELYNAYRATGQLISPDGRTVQFSAEVGDGDTSNPAAMDAIPGLRADLDRVATAAGASASGLLGTAEFMYDVSRISNLDLERIIPLVALLIAILLAAVMRSLVAPLYLVASVVLSYLAALGLAGVIFVHLGGQEGLNFVLPFLMFVFLMALGSDYNILVMSRIREEAHHLPLRDAVARAVGRTGITVTTAGVILGGSFAVLAIAAGGTAGGEQIQQIGYGVAAGVLMDTFCVRSLLVPSLVVLLGRWNWWPAHLNRSAVDPSSGDGARAIDTAAG